MASYRDDRRAVVFLDRCRRLRQEATDAERRLWRMLRGRRLGNHKFRRQHEFGPYILDFFCVEARLVVEADGGQHFLPEGIARDHARDEYLSSRGIRVLRLSNRDVLLSPELVEEEIARRLGEVCRLAPPTARR